MFKCTKCGETKPREEFYKNDNTKKGVTSRCRLCILPNKGEKLMSIPINEKFNFLHDKYWNRWFEMLVLILH